MGHPPAAAIYELVRRAELRLEQYLIARDLAPADRQSSQSAEAQVNASLAMLAYLRFLQNQMQVERLPMDQLH
jgi:hypothetical protein